MANRYWVGGSGTWDTTSTANWSAASGGAAGASAPVTADNAIFDANSGSSYTVTLGANVAVLSVNAATAVSATLDFSTNVISVSGNATGIWSAAGFTSYLGTPLISLTYSGPTGTRTITPGGAAANPLSINITAGSDTVALTGIYNNINFTGFSGTLASNGRTVYGDFTASSMMTFAASASTTLFAATSGTKTITSSGKTLDFPITFNGVGGTWQLADNLTVGSTRTVTLTNGTLDGNGQNVSLGSFALGSGTKTLTLGSGTWTVVGSGTAWNANTNVANLTVSASTGTVNMTSASAKTFAGGAKTWPTLNQGGAGTLTIQQSNTFANITNTAQPATITLTSGTTQTVTAFSASGTAGNLITLNASTPGSQATLSDSGGTNSVSYVSITDIAATGGASWEAYTANGNVNGGNNTGWLFEPAVASITDNIYELRSFTEQRRF